VAYVRKKGNQLCVVQGRRDPETKKVVQTTLFTIYSKAEALAATGEQSYVFRNLIQSDNPQVRFDWAKIDAAIRSNLDHLPDLYAYKKERVEAGFREALQQFTFELASADPRSLVSSARTLQANRHELQWLRDMIDWRLKHCDQEEDDWNADNPFYWRTISNRRAVPLEAWEELESLFNKGEYDRVAALARLMTECWPKFTVGFNYRGLVEMERCDFGAAVKHFDRAIEVGRSAFPKRIAKERWWLDTDTRPYIRALIYKAQALNRAGDLDASLALIDVLEKKCHQDITAAAERAPVLLNAGRFAAAERASRYVMGVYPAYALIRGFSLYELGRAESALASWLVGALRFPRSARMLVGLARGTAPKSYFEVEDHNAGVHHSRNLDAYLGRRRLRSKAFFRRVMNDPEVVALIVEAKDVKQRWRDSDGDESRGLRARMAEMETEAFAEKQARGLYRLLQGETAGGVC